MLSQHVTSTYSQTIHSQTIHSKTIRMISSLSEMGYSHFQIPPPPIRQVALATSSKMRNTGQVGCLQSEVTLNPEWGNTLYYTILYYTVLYCTILYYTILYDDILYH